MEIELYLKNLPNIKQKSALLSMVTIFALATITPAYAQYYYPSPAPSPPPPQPNFSISASPRSLTIQQGTTASSTVTVTSINGFNSVVTLLISGNPSSVKAFFSPNSIIPSGGASASSTLTITISESANPNTYSLAITGVGSSQTHTTTISLTIVRSAAAPTQTPVPAVPTQPLTTNETVKATVPQHPISIPSWIHNNAKWWSEGQVGDNDFVKGIQYLIQQGIMQIPKQQNPSPQSGTHTIPAWIKNNAGWWASGQISDDEFVKGIQYLISVGIMKV